jgi:hypothetical protein
MKKTFLLISLVAAALLISRRAAAVGWSKHGQ